MTSPYSAACPDGLPLCPGFHRRSRKPGARTRSFRAPDRDPSVRLIALIYTMKPDLENPGDLPALGKSDQFVALGLVDRCG